MRILAAFTSLFVLGACAVAGRRSGAPTLAGTLAPLSQVTRVVLTDAASGMRLGAVQRADSVAGLVNLYNHLAVGWTEGTAPSPEIDAAFYQGAVPIAHLTLASGAFEIRPGGRPLRRSASPNEALAFVQLAGIPVKHDAHATAVAIPGAVTRQPPN